MMYHNSYYLQSVDDERHRKAARGRLAADVGEIERTMLARRSGSGRRVPGMARGAAWLRSLTDPS
jgi:hypothetical protein